MEKYWIGYKDLWTNIFKYLDMDDYLNLELSNKNLRSKIVSYYHLQTKNCISSDSTKFNQNYKKIFFSKYLNSFVILNVDSEFDGLPLIMRKENTENMDHNQSNRKNSDRKDYGSNEDSSPLIKEKIKLNVQIIHNTNTTHSEFENSLFSQE